MINYLKFSLLIIMSLFVFSCQQEEDISTDLEQSSVIEQLNREHFSCWNSNLGISNAGITDIETGEIFKETEPSIFDKSGKSMLFHITSASRMFGLKKDSHLVFFSGEASTFNAFYFSPKATWLDGQWVFGDYERPGKIYFGMDLFNAAKAKGGGLLGPIAILAHEVAHHIQHRFKLPTIIEETVRSKELEADAFMGYYLKKKNIAGVPKGVDEFTGAPLDPLYYSWSNIGPALAIFSDLGDTETSNPDHHGTSEQRRSAIRLGWHLGKFELTAKDLDKQFFKFYNKQVLTGKFKIEDKKKKGIDAEIDAYIESKLEELIKLNTGELNIDDFNNLD